MSSQNKKLPPDIEAFIQQEVESKNTALQAEVEALRQLHAFDNNAVEAVRGKIGELTVSEGQRIDLQAQVDWYKAENNELKAKYEESEKKRHDQVMLLSDRKEEVESLNAELLEAVTFTKAQLFEMKWNGEEGVIDVDYVGFDADGILERINKCLSRAEGKDKQL